MHSWIYSAPTHLHRLLRLLANEVAGKARGIVGESPLQAPEESLLNLKLALRVCAAFRGCYLDYRERGEGLLRAQREKGEGLAQQRGEPDRTQLSRQHPAAAWSTTGGHAPQEPCPWPPRNSPVFASLNGMMEHCNDLLELVQTVMDFRELEIATYGVGVADAEVGGAAPTDPLVADICHEFAVCLQTFEDSSKDLLSLEPECSFEEGFFQLRSTVRSLEQRLGVALLRTFDLCPSLAAELRLLECFQGVFRREAVKACLEEHYRGVVAKIRAEVQTVSHTLSDNIAHPPSHPNVPPMASKLLWLHALRERVSVPMEQLREVAPQLLEGDLGWRLRQEHSELTRNIQSHISETEEAWSLSVPPGLAERLKDCVLTRTPEGHLVVNLDPTLREVLQEIRYMTRPPLGVALPRAAQQLLKGMEGVALGGRSTSLGVVVQVYNELWAGLSEVDQLLFQHKLQQMDNLVADGLERLDWLSADFPDFVAKAKALVCGDLQSALRGLHQHTDAIRATAGSWALLPHLDIFEGEGGVTLEELQGRHNVMLETLERTLPPAVEKISAHLQAVFQSVDASQESPAWGAYLALVDDLVLGGLRTMVLTAVSTLVTRAHRYEQGDQIPALVTVQLELQGGEVQFSPPLSSHSALPSVPELVQRWMDSYTRVARLARRFSPGDSESCYPVLREDPQIRSAIAKVSAHLETNARQCQSVRKRFSIYSFLWEQDVGATFESFMLGQATPHPRRFTRPETVRSRASARALSARSSSQSQQQLAAPAPEATLLGVMGVSDWDFLRPPGAAPSEEEDTSRRPSLDDFDGEIAVFQGVLERLSNVEGVAGVGWLRVDQRPVKQALSSLAAKWKHTFTSYLERQIQHVLGCLERFFCEIEPEVESISGEESGTQAFMHLMAVFNKVNTQQVEMDTKFGALHRAVLMLDKFGHPLSPTAREQFNTAPQRWANLKKRVSLGKQRIGPRIQASGELISQDLLQFSWTFTALRQEFQASRCLHHECSRGDALEAVGVFRRRLGVLQAQARDLIELQELLETSIFNFAALNEFEEELTALQDVWSIAELVLSEHTQWQALCWYDVKTANLMVATDRQLEPVSALPPVCHGWDVFLHLCNTIQEVQTTLPLVEGLRGPAMRPRHWKQVLQYAAGNHTLLLGRGGAFDPTHLQEMTFGELLELRLHAHYLEVLAVVEHAERDVAIESLLKTLEEVWLSRQLELRPYQRATGLSRQETISEFGLQEHSATTPRHRSPSARVTSALRRGQSTGRASVLSAAATTLTGETSVAIVLHNTRGIFETLESHQMSLQSQFGTAAATAFSDDLTRWHKQLQTVEAVLGAWLEVQQLWVGLEEVYGSPEVQAHLPGPAFSFSSVDRELRELSMSATRNPAVMPTCLKEGLLLSLEKMQTALLQCQAALLQYMEGRRQRWPWFYLLPTEDILLFVCYGSNPCHISSNISKLLPYASSLVIDHAPHAGGGSGRITGVVSTLGEQLELNQPVHCEGSVESILQHLLTSLSATIQNQVVTVVTGHILKNGAPSLSDLPAVWSSSVSTQVSVLATQLALELSTELALKESGRGVSNALGELAKEVASLMATAAELLQGTTSDRIADAARTVSALAVVHSESQLVLDGGEAPGESPTDEQAEGSSSVGSGRIVEEARVGGAWRTPVSRDMANKLQAVLMVLSAFRLKAGVLTNQVASSDADPTHSFTWESMLHFLWSSRDQRCVLSSLHASLPYGHHYCGSSARLVATPTTERCLVHLLQTVGKGTGALLTGSECSGKSSLVRDLAVSAGRPLFSLHCSPHTHHTTLTNCIRGMVATGCWLFLHHVTRLRPAVLQSACSLLLAVQGAGSAGAQTVDWPSGAVRLNPDKPGACFGSVVLPRSCKEAASATLPHALLEAFRPCHAPKPQLRPILEALLLAHDFEGGAHLARLLATFCTTAEELLNRNPISAVRGDEAITAGSSPTLPLGLPLLRAVISQARGHLKEFAALGLLQGGGALQVASGVHSEFSGSTRANLKYSSMVMQGSESERQTQRQSLEEFAVVLALKDWLLPGLPPASPEHTTAIQLIGDLFPGCDLTGLLSHEEEVREGLAGQALEDRAAVESARESRAASAMQMVAEELQPSEVGKSLENHIIHCCLLHQLSPTPSFQLATAHLHALLQPHPLVAIAGPSGSGKTSCIKVTAEVLRELGEVVSCVTLASGAMREEQLFGFLSTEDGLWREGLLSKLLARLSSTGSATTTNRWLIIDGKLSPAQLDTLVSCLAPDSSIKLSNGKTIQLNRSYRFLLEMPDLSALTPSTANKIGKLCMSPGGITWREVVRRWLGSRGDRQPELWPLFQKYVAKCLNFLAPVVARTSGSSGEGAGPAGLEPQSLKLSEVHLASTLCNILQSQLAVTVGELGPAARERQFSYAAVWAFGGFFTAKNRTVFESWWRAEFGRSPELAVPGRGLWDYYLDPQTHAFVHFSEAVPHYSPPGNPREAPFVPTVQSMAVNHLVRMLIDRDCPVLLNGSTGSGKTATLLQLLKCYCVQGVTEAGLLHIYASRSTGAEGVWSQLQGALEWRWGRNHTPKGCRRLVCLIDDLHNAQPPSNPPSSSISELVRHHLAGGGVHDPASGKWYSISDIHYICTSNASPGRELDPRFLKHFTTLHWEDYDSDTLFHIFSAVLTSHFCPTNQGPSPVRTSQSDSGVDPEVLQALVQTAVQVHEKVRAMFLPTPERLHYLFSLRHIAAIFRKLCLGLGRGSSSHDLLLLWQQESWWQYAGALSSEVDRERYWEVLSHALRKFFRPEELPQILSERSHRLPPEAAAALRAQLTHHVSEHNAANPTLHVPLYESTVEEAWYLSRTLTSPHDLGHTLLLGHTHPEPVVRLAALHAGFTVLQPSHMFSPSLLASKDPRGMSGGSYGVQQLTGDLTAVYTSAGVKGERLLLLLTQAELFHESFLDCLYHFVKDAAISHTFPPEEQSHITSAIRAELSQAGLPFSTETAWSFFIDRVRSNLRVVVAVPQVGVATPSGCGGWTELLNTLRVCYHLPWDRKQLMDVAMYHLAAQPSIPPPCRENVAHLLGSLLLRLRAGSLLHPTCSNHSYQHFAERFVHELVRSQKASKERRERLAAALECVRRAEGRGAWLEDKLGREKEVLREKIEGCSKLLTQIGQDTAISGEHSKLVSRQRARISHLHRTIPDYEHALELVREEKAAIVAGLRQMVGQLELGSMQELRGVGRPPPAVEELLGAVIIVVKSPSADTSWTKGAKRLMANLDRFRELLLEYSGRERGSEVILEALDPLLANPDLSPEQLERGPGGLAAAQLCRWVNGIVRLHTTLQTRLRPLEARMEAMKNSLKECSEKLSMQEAKVEDLQQRLAGLCSALESASVERSRQQDAVNSMARELRETQDFINTLAGVHERWAEELPSSASTSTQAVGKLVTAVALAMFLGPSPPHSQQHTLTQHLAPLLQERGVGLHWQTADDFIRVLCLHGQEIAAVDGSAVDDITGESPTHHPKQPSAPPTYAHVCSSLLPLLVPGEFLDQWLARGYSLPELLRVGGVVSTWNRWPLIYDPEGFAASWLQRYRGEELKELDATTRSSEFFHTLEQALLQGGPVLVRGVASSLDPALQPLVQLGHTWHSDTGAKVIRFCGRKLHVHPSFQLYLSTSSPPHTLPPALLTTTAVVDFSASLPLAREILLDSAFQRLHGDGGWGEAASRAAECRQKLAAVEGELLASLGEQRDRQDGYWWGTERVGRHMATSRELETEFRGHMDKLRQLSAAKSLLLPLAQHGALLWGLLQSLESAGLSWEGLSSVFHSAVDHAHRQNPELWAAITASEAAGRGRESALRELQKAVDQAVLQDAAYYLPQDRWLRLATVLSLLAHGDPQSDPALLQEQLLLLSRGEGQVDMSDAPPSPPPNVPRELWLRLHKLPLSPHYLAQVVESIDTAPQFWAKFEPGSEGEVGMAALPWREDGNPITLEDLVLVSSLRPEAALRALQEETQRLVEDTPRPLLADTVQGCKGKPLLILYDEGNVTSSVNLCHLEAEIRRALQGKSVRVLCLGEGVEGKVGEVLVQPACDCLLVTDIQRAGQWEGPEWLRLLLWRTRKALATGCQVVLTASVHAPLPPDLLRASRVLLLSSTATSLTSTLPSAVRRGEGRGFLPTLFLVLSSIPEEVLSQCGSLPEQLKTLSFNLAVLHTKVALSGSESGRPAWYGVPPYTSLLAAISHALSLTKASPGPAGVPHILSSLQLYVMELYSLWLSEAALGELATACLSQGGVAPGGTLNLGGGATQVVVPASVVEPRCYAEHVAGLVQTEQCPPAVSPAHLTEIIEQLWTVLATLTSNNHSPSSDRTPPDAAKVCESLKWVLEQLPPSLPLDGASPETPPMGGAWTSLPSTQHYQAFLFSKAVSQFNSTLTTIRHEAEDLLRSAAVGFDSLPFPLAPVLSSVSRGELPRHWAPVPTGTRPPSLQEGVEELYRLHSSLQKLSNK